MKKGQSNRLTMQQKEGQGPVTIFHKDAQIHDAEVGNTSLFVKKQLEYEFPMLTCKLRSNRMPVPLLRNGYSIFNGTKYR